jgi:SAM-dependent methyltransferase
MSETSLCRHITVPFCQGNGCDVGSGGDPVVPWAIQVDLPDEAFIQYGHAHDGTMPIQYRGDARNLPFKDATMDFVYSSHLIEDFEDWTIVLEEFARVLKHGGNLIVMVPDRKLFRAAVAGGQNDNASHRHEFHVGELTDWARMRGGFEVVFDQLTLIPQRGIKDYNIIFVAKKK